MRDIKDTPGLISRRLLEISIPIVLWLHPHAKSLLWTVDHLPTTVAAQSILSRYGETAARGTSFHSHHLRPAMRQAQLIGVLSLPDTAPP